MPINFRAVAPQQQVETVKGQETKNIDSEISAKYLQNLALMNAASVKKVDLNATKTEPYQNNLRSMIQNN